MRTGRFVNLSVSAAIARTCGQADRLPDELGSAAFVLLTTPIGAGQSCALYEITNLKDWLILELPACADLRSFAAALYKTAYREVSCHWGISQVIERSIRQIRSLREQGQRGPLIVHGADRLTPKLGDLLLDLGDLTGMPIILCGSRRLRQLVEGAPEGSFLERVKARVVLDAKLAGPTLRDARLLADELAEIAIAPDLLKVLFERSGGAVRALLASFRQAEELAAMTGGKALSLADWRAIAGEAERAQLSATNTAAAVRRQLNGAVQAA